MGSQLVDHDGDGRLDFFTATYDGSPHIAYGVDGGFAEPQHLLDRDGERIRLEMYWDTPNSQWVNVGADNRHCISAVLFDWDGDGDHDLLMGDKNQGNLFLDSLFDAEVHMIDEGLKGPLRPKKIKALAEELRRQGRRPYIIPGGASNALGSLGYVNAVREICEQLEEQETTAQYLVCAVGSCGMIAGLIVGAEYFRAPFQVIGISVEGEKNELAGKIAALANEIAELLDMDVSFERDKIVVYDEYVGTGYGIPTTEGIEALKLVARKEGIILDPVYTSKAMAGLMDLISQNRFTPQESVIFLHSGGTASVFTYVEEISGQQSGG